MLYLIPAQDSYSSLRTAPPAQDSEDIMVWPDDSWCYRYELEEFGSDKSDDYETLSFGTPKYQSFQHWQDAC